MVGHPFSGLCHGNNDPTVFQLWQQNKKMATRDTTWHEACTRQRLVGCPMNVCVRVFAHKLIDKQAQQPHDALEDARKFRKTLIN
jgi:hypothetical protein